MGMFMSQGKEIAMKYMFEWIRKRKDMHVIALKLCQIWNEDDMYRKVHSCIREYYKNNLKVVKMEADILEVLNGDVRIYRTEDNHTCFVPLWHDEIYYEQYDILFLIRVVSTVMILFVDEEEMISRENAVVRICENTFDVHVYVDSPESKSNIDRKEIRMGDIVYFLEEKDRKIVGDYDCYRFAKRGIFLCNDDDIYDTSASSDIFIYLKI
tara:strand:- start:44 stop:676 length:633 start_codon:yes stop_codon:yes gene_type:complete